MNDIIDNCAICDATSKVIEELTSLKEENIKLKADWIDQEKAYVKEVNRLKAELASLREWQPWPPKEAGWYYVKLEDIKGTTMCKVEVFKDHEPYISWPQTWGVTPIAYCGPFKPPGEGVR